MPIRTGTRLGPYGITPAIGTGEMGEVYRAIGAPDNRNCWHASTSYLPPSREIRQRHLVLDADIRD